MGSISLTLRAGLRRSWRSWLALALLLGVMGGVTLAAADGARRTETAYPRLLDWSHASAIQVAPAGTGMRGYYRALGALPQVAAMSTADLLNMTIPAGHGYVPGSAIQVYASPDGRLGVSVDRVKILAGRPPDPADPQALMVDQRLADMAHVRPGSSLRLYVVPNDDRGNPDLKGAYPLTFRVAAIVVSSDQVEPVASGQKPWALLSPAFLRTPAAGRIPTSGDEAYVRLRPGASLAAFLTAASAMAAQDKATGRKIFTISAADTIAATSRAIRPDAVALALFAVLSGLVALGIIGQLLSRQLVLEASWFGVLRALGMTRGQLLALSVAPVGVAALAGGCLAVAMSAAASPLMPIGPARLAEPAPGVEVNLALAATGFAIIVLAPLVAVLPAALRAASSPDRTASQVAAPQPSRLAAALSRAGTLSGGIGVRMAFERGHGRTVVPVRSALAAITVATVAVIAAGVFGSSLIALVSTPHKYGQNWSAELDLQFGAAPGQLLARIVAQQHGVTGYADGVYGQVGIGTRSVAAIGVTPVRGAGYVTLLAGRLPAGPGQIALGARTLQSLHRRLGQTIQVTANSFGIVTGSARPMRIVGEVTLPELGQRGSFPGTDLGNGAVVWPPLLSSPFAQTRCTAACYNFVLLRYGQGMSPGAAASLMASVTRAGCPPGSCSVSADQQPVDIRGYAAIRDTPLILCALLALIGAAALVHVLVTGVRRRRRDLAILKIIGMRQTQLMRAVCWQAIALVLAALVPGIPLGIVVGRWAWILFAGSLGVGPAFRVPALLVLGVLAVTPLLGIAAAIVPALNAASVAPAAVLRTE